MSTAALLLITHEHIASGLLSIAHDILNQTIINTASIEVPMNSAIDDIHIAAAEKISQLDTDSGLLILTDLVGSTPFNIATQLKEKQENALLVSGLNLPMLLKLSNYRTLPLDKLAEKAIIGGQSGIAKHG